MSEMMTGAEMVIRALQDQGVEHIFGYPGGAVLPIYDALFHQEKVRHVLVRHEQGAVHAAEGYARSTGKVGVRARHLRSRRHQCGHRAHRRADGFGAHRLHHRAGADASHRLRRLPGMRHGRHHAALHEAQLPREVDRGPAAHPARGLLRGRQRPAGPGRRRPAEGHPVRERPLRAADEQPAQDLPARGEGRHRAHQGGGRADGAAPSGRSSTPAAASSIPVRKRPRCCASSSS